MSLIRYGRQLTLTSEGAVTIHREVTLQDFQPVHEVQVNTETIHVKSDKDILATFLNMLDQQKLGEIDNIGLQCIRSPQTGRIRIEKTWTVPNLH